MFISMFLSFYFTLDVKNPYIIITGNQYNAG